MRRLWLVAVAVAALLAAGGMAAAQGNYGPDFMAGMPTISGSLVYTDGNWQTVGPSGITTRSDAVAAGNGWDYGQVMAVCAVRVALAQPLLAGDFVRLDVAGTEIGWTAAEDGEHGAILEWHSPGVAIEAQFVYIWHDGAAVAEVYAFEYPEFGVQCEPLDGDDPPGGGGPGGGGPVDTPPTGDSNCPDPWRRDPRTGYCYDWWDYTKNVIGNRGLAAYPSGTSWDGTTAQWVGIADVDYYSVEYWVEDETGGAGWPRQVAGCEAVPGSWSAGAVLGCLVSDKENLAGRRFVVRVAAWRDGVVVADSSFVVQGAAHVELGYYSLARFDRWFSELLEALTVNGAESQQQLQRIENAVERLGNWGPFGAAKETAQQVSDFTEAVRSGQHVPISAGRCDGERPLWCFPLKISYTGHEFALELPIEEILAVSEWQVLWTLISATMWVSFGLWVLYRIAPRLGA